MAERKHTRLLSRKILTMKTVLYIDSSCLVGVWVCCVPCGCVVYLGHLCSGSASTHTFSMGPFA